MNDFGKLRSEECGFKVYKLSTILSPIHFDSFTLGSGDRQRLRVLSTQDGLKLKSIFDLQVPAIYLMPPNI